MTEQMLTNLSPLDGRYADSVDELRPLLSEMGLIRCRIEVEVEWLIFLVETGLVAEIDRASSSWEQIAAELRILYQNFSIAEAKQVKILEAEMRHDVKAVEIFLGQQIDKLTNLAPGMITALKNFVHFGCTSEDINNLAWSLMISRAVHEVLLPHYQKLQTALDKLIRQTADMAMLARTHGQPASPTTLGKEVAVFRHRLSRLTQALKQGQVSAKFNGATGNFNAHTIAFPELDWLQLSHDFVSSFEGIDWQPCSTQIEPHDWLAELLDTQARLNSVLLDLCRDFWSYISLDYFSQQTNSAEVGSSTMPHKVNPIDFENAEGNLGIANGLLRHLAEKLPISRFQRDLSDSTSMRNIGPAVGHCLLACKSLLRGLGRLQPNTEALQADLDERWELLAEAVQTVMRRYGIQDPYSELKKLTRNRKVTRSVLHRFIESQALPAEVIEQLKNMTPADYTGIAGLLAKKVLSE